MEKKYTVSEMFDVVAEFIESGCIPEGLEKADLTKFIAKRKELASKKNSKPSKKELEKKAFRETIADEVCALLAEYDEPTLGGTLFDDLKPLYKDLTNQKLVSILTSLVKAGKVEKAPQEKTRKMLYSLKTEVTEDQSLR